MVSDDYINIQDMRANITLKYSTTKTVTCNDYIFYIYIYINRKTKLRTQEKMKKPKQNI